MNTRKRDVDVAVRDNDIEPAPNGDIIDIIAVDSQCVIRHVKSWPIDNRIM